MPLRVAEKAGYLHAVSKCYDCPYVEQLKHDNRVGPIWACGYYNPGGKRPENIDTPKEVLGMCIPVWCPLPTHLDHMLRAPSKTITEFMVRQENAEAKLRGKHPENIVRDAPGGEDA